MGVVGVVQGCLPLEQKQSFFLLGILREDFGPEDRCVCDYGK